MKYPDDQQKLNHENPFILAFSEIHVPRELSSIWYSMTLWLLARVKFMTWHLDVLSLISQGSVHEYTEHLISQCEYDILVITRVNLYYLKYMHCISQGICNFTEISYRLSEIFVEY